MKNMKIEVPQNTLAVVGSWAFTIGLLLALVVGLTSQIFGVGLESPLIVSVLILAGLVVGFLNITSSETRTFLLASVSLVIVLSFGSQVLFKVVMIGGYLTTTMGAMMIFIVPATIVVALKAIIAAAKDN